MMSKNQFTGTATQPQCNRKFCQFNKDQYCMKPSQNNNEAYLDVRFRNSCYPGSFQTLFGEREHWFPKLSPHKYVRKIPIPSLDNSLQSNIR